MIIGIEHKADIFDRDQQEQGPEDKRHGAQDSGLGDRYLAVGLFPKENLSEGITLQRRLCLTS